MLIIFLPISLNMCFGCSNEPSHWDGSFEYPQHMFWMRNKENNFPIRTLIWRSDKTNSPRGYQTCFMLNSTEHVVYHFQKYFQNKLLISLSYLRFCLNVSVKVFKNSKILNFWNFICLFVRFDSLRPINNLSVKQKLVFLGWTSTKLG